jgi:hypothetical protein
MSFGATTICTGGGETEGHRSTTSPAMRSCRQSLPAFESTSRETTTQLYWSQILAGSDSSHNEMHDQG